MNVLTTTTDPQSLVVIPRSNEFTLVVLTDDSTNTHVNVDIDSTEDKGYYFVINIITELIENRFYNVEIYNEDDLVYRGKAFCTNQPTVSYSVNNDNYISNSTTNQFITYE